MESPKTNQPNRRHSLRLAIPTVVSLLFMMVLLWGFKGVTSVSADPGTLYVEGASGSDTGNCQDPAAPCQTIGYAISQTVDGDTILITGGTYTENLKITQGNAINIRGGYQVSGSAWTPSGSEATVINGNRADSTIEIRADSNTILGNVTVTGGKGVYDSTFGTGCGGFKIQDSDVTIRNSEIISNVAGVGMGGAICAAGDSREITLTIEDSIISDNDGIEGGGALNLFHVTALLTNTLIYGNKASENDVLQVYEDVGADSHVTFQNCTIADNNPTGQYAIQISDLNTLVIRNSIMWNNGQNIKINDPCTNCVTVTYSDIEGGWTGTGNIDEDPLFMDAANGDYRLQKDSLCIDTGTNTGAPDSDLDQMQRPLDGDGDGTAITDIGAYEFMQSAEEPVAGFRESGPLVPELTTYIPTPLDVSTEPEVIGANIGFAAAAMMLLTFAITLLNKILREQEINLQRVVSPLKSIGSLLSREESRLGRSLGRRSLPDVLRFAGIIIFYGVIFSLLDPGWNPLSVTGFYLFITMTLAFGVVGIADDLVKYNSARRWGVDTNLKLRPANLLLAIASTTFSRLLALVPGIMFGTPAAFEVDESALDEHKRRRLLWITLGTMFVIGIGLWLFTTGTALLQKAQISDTMAIFVGGLEALLLVVFAVALQNLFVQMLAFPGSVGRDLMHWNRWVWGGVLFGITFAFYHTLINPKGNLAEALETANVRNFYLIIWIFVVGTVIVWFILWVQRVWRER